MGGNNARNRPLWVLPIATAAALVLLIVIFRVIGGWTGIGIGAVLAVAFLLLVAAWAENDFGPLDVRVLLRRDAWRFRGAATTARAEQDRRQHS